MAEALLLGDRIAVLHAGRLVQVGTPSELLRAPADERVAELLRTPRRQAEALDALLGEKATS
jgi:osmoprotectant transport system ATP-binding protein